MDCVEDTECRVWCACEAHASRATEPKPISQSLLLSRPYPDLQSEEWSGSPEPGCPTRGHNLCSSPGVCFSLKTILEIFQPYVNQVDAPGTSF